MSKQKVSKKVRMNAADGLWIEQGNATYGTGYRDGYYDDEEDTFYPGAYEIENWAYGPSSWQGGAAMNRHFETIECQTLEALEAEMRKIEPDLRKWRMAHTHPEVVGTY